MKLSAGSCCFGRNRSNGLVFAIRFLPGLPCFADVDSAFEERAVFNRDAGRDYVAGERTVTANIHAITGREVATNFPEHNDLTGIDVGGDYTIAANGDAISGEVDGSLDAAVNVE